MILLLLSHITPFKIRLYHRDLYLGLLPDRDSTPSMVNYEVCQKFECEFCDLYSNKSFIYVKDTTNYVLDVGHDRNRELLYWAKHGNENQRWVICHGKLNAVKFKNEDLCLEYLPDIDVLRMQNCNESENQLFIMIEDEDEDHGLATQVNVTMRHDLDGHFIRGHFGGGHGGSGHVDDAHGAGWGGHGGAGHAGNGHGGAGHAGDGHSAFDIGNGPASWGYGGNGFDHNASGRATWGNGGFGYANGGNTDPAFGHNIQGYGSGGPLGGSKVHGAVAAFERGNYSPKSEITNKEKLWGGYHGDGTWDDHNNGNHPQNQAYFDHGHGSRPYKKI